MTTSDSAPSTAFYEQRHLPVPDRELWPSSTDQLCQMISELDDTGTDWRILGDGQHTRRRSTADTTAPSTVIRTEHLDDVLELDTESRLIHVEAGMRWRQLDDLLADEGLSLQRYGLHPPSATIGGMLARHRPGPTALRAGALLDGCVSIGGFDADRGDYRYLVAPRKASGPDLRYEFIGAGDAGGAILDATLVVWRPVAERLLRYDECAPGQATDTYAAMFEAGITPTWIHYSWKRRTLQFALAAPGQLLRARILWLIDRIGNPDQRGDADDVRTRRRWLEARHPDRRSDPKADRTRVVWVAPSALDDDPSSVFGDGVEEVEIPRWTPRRLEAYVRYEDGADTDAIATDDDAVWATSPVVA